MGTKTVDENGATTDNGTEAATDVAKSDVAKSDEVAPDVTERDGQAGAETGAGEDDAVEDEAAEQPVAPGNASAGVGQGAAAVVSAGLGLVSLTGSWLGTVAQARESLFGQLETAAAASVATQIQQVYGDSWNANAMVAGVFALVALIVGVVVLVRPAFGAPDRVQAPWIKSVAWAGVSFGVLGLVLAVLKYTDVLLSMPTG